MPNTVSCRYFKTSPEIIQLAVMLHVRFPLSMKNVEDLLYERGMNVSYESVRYWWQWFGLKKAFEKLPNVYQHRTSSGMQWQGIQPVIHL
jgi:putative transposase